MRTTLTVGDGILEELMSYTGAKTRTEAVRVGLDEYLRRQRVERLRALRGKIDIDVEALRVADRADVDSTSK